MTPAEALARLAALEKRSIHGADGMVAYHGEVANALPALLAVAEAGVRLQERCEAHWGGGSMWAEEEAIRAALDALAAALGKEE